MSEFECAENDCPVVIESLTRRFRKNKVALDEVDLKIPKGSVFGLVGENGAGKTTLIKHILGLFKAQSGSVRVFGRDPVKEPEKVLADIGYLSEDRDLPDWMRVRELMLFQKAFYPKWDDKYAEELLETFDLDPATKVKNLSRGQRAQAGLLVALAHKPPLLLLDEPSSGLDVVVRRHILSAIIRTVADEGRTVLFSSHLLDEVERVADHVAMIHKGKMVHCGPLDEVKASFCRLSIRFAEAVTETPDFPGALFWEGRGRDWSAVCDGDVEAFKQAAAERNAVILEEAVPSLEEMFVARVNATNLEKGRV